MSDERSQLESSPAGGDTPAKLIWGRYDPYITVAVAERRLTQLRRATFTVLPAGHWLQAVARAMLE